MDIDPKTIIELGFPVAMALTIWRSYQELVTRVIDVVDSNTRAIEGLSRRIDELEKRHESAGP